MLKKLFIIIVILIIVITALSVILLLSQKPSSKPSQTEPTSRPSEPLIKKPEPKIPQEETKTANELDNSFLQFDGKKIAPASAEARQKSELQELARFYLTNFGTYSANNFEHIVNLKNFFNQKVSNYLDNFISQEREKLQNRPFYSIKTEIISVVFESLDLNDGFAKANVSALRIENEPPKFTNRSFEQKAEVWLSKIEGEWQVVRVEWWE